MAREIGKTRKETWCPNLKREVNKKKLQANQLKIIGKYWKK